MNPIELDHVDARRKQDQQQEQDKRKNANVSHCIDDQINVSGGPVEQSEPIKHLLPQLHQSERCEHAELVHWYAYLRLGFLCRYHHQDYQNEAHAKDIEYIARLRLWEADLVTFEGQLMHT